MREADQTFYLLDGANELSGPLAMLWVARRWPALRRELVGARGYIGHRLWFAWPWTVGVTTWWQDEAAAYRFAHMPQHLRLWAWAAGTGRTRGGWLAHYRYVRGGPLWGNGVQSLATRFANHVPAPPGAPARPVVDGIKGRRYKG
jgi:hypothetical protein